MNIRLEDKIVGMVTVRSVIIVALAFGYTMTVYNLPKLIGHIFPYQDFSTPLDDMIPLIAWTSVFYLTCYLIWVINYLIAALDEEKKMRTFFTADFIIKTICFGCFIFIPAMIVRPEISGNGFFDWVMNVIYTVDSPTELMPSMHCTQSWFCWIAVRNNDRIPKAYKIFTLVFVLAICISTVTTKQHYVLDSVVGVFLAEIIYQLVKIYYNRRTGQVSTPDN